MLKTVRSLRVVSIVILCFIGRQILAQESSDQVAPSEVSTVVDEQSTSFETNKLIRPKYTDELNKESSSFVADPDSLDPLPLKKESLKEDEEPVLDDIKSILKTKSASTVQPKVKNNIKNNESRNKLDTKSQKNPQKTVKKSKKNKQNKPLVKVSPPKQDHEKLSPVQSIVESLVDDSPDYVREQKFHSVYKKYNESPTPNDVWGKVVSNGQNVNVYTVQKGDTLASISDTLFGDSKFWPKIWAINNIGITNPHQIYPGQKIYFQDGTSQSAPVMQVGEASDLGQIVLNQGKSTEEGEDETEVAGQGLGKYDRQYTEFNSNKELLDSSKGRKSKYQRPPPSLPKTVSTEYLNPSAPTMTVLDFQKQVIEDPPVVNPYVLSSSKLKTDLKIKESDVEKLLCRDDHYVPPILNVGQDTTLEPNDYIMLVREDYKFSRLKETYAYKRNGMVRLNADGSLRIQKCIENSTSDVIFITENSLSAQVIVPQETFTKYKSGNHILDGFAVYGQSIYSSHQFALLNAEQGELKDGDIYSVYSEEAGQSVGKIKILQKTGTLAIGYILDAHNVIQDGDKIVP